MRISWSPHESGHQNETHPCLAGARGRRARLPPGQPHRHAQPAPDRPRHRRLAPRGSAAGRDRKGQGALPHAHPGIEQVCYLLSGTARAQVADEWADMAAGDCCYFPPDVPHVFTVTSDQPARLLVIYTPPYEESPNRVIRGFPAPPPPDAAPAGRGGRRSRPRHSTKETSHETIAPAGRRAAAGAALLRPRSAPRTIPPSPSR